MEDKLEKVKAEIERLMKDVEIHSDIGDIQQDSYYDGRRSVLCLIRDFINSMQEECNITGIKSKEATGKLKECIDNITDESLTKARKQLEENPQECMYARDNYTDEDRKVLCDGCEEECEFNKKEEPVSEDLEEAIEDAMPDANWYIEENNDTTGEDAYNSIQMGNMFKAGANWKEQQMMAKAVEATIAIPYQNGDSGYTQLVYSKEALPFGDKIKVIIIKEDLL